MLPQNAKKALSLLAQVPKSIEAIHNLPGLQPVDFMLLEAIAGYSLLLANRLQDKANGENLTRAFVEMRTTAADILAVEPPTYREQ